MTRICHSNYSSTLIVEPALFIGNMATHSNTYQRPRPSCPIIEIKNCYLHHACSRFVIFNLPLVISYIILLMKPSRCRILYFYTFYNFSSILSSSIIPTVTSDKGEYYDGELPLPSACAVLFEALKSYCRLICESGTTTLFVFFFSRVKPLLLYY